jgi:hypothetical protein
MPLQMSAVQPLERRISDGASIVGSTADVPEGTLLRVPSVPPGGPSGTAPVVAVNTAHWYKDPTFLSAAGGAVLALASPVVEVLSETQPFHWRPFIAGCILALVAYFRNRDNSVLK